MKKYLFFLMFIIPVLGFSKVGEVKFNKFVVYEGEIENKVPSGRGVLKVYNPQDKKIVQYVLEGIFDTGKCEGTITKQSDFSLEGTFSYIFNSNDKNNIFLEISSEGKAIYARDNIKLNSNRLRHVLIENFVMAFCFDKKNKNWVIKYGKEKGDSMKVPVEFAYAEIPDFLRPFGYDIGKIATNKGIAIISNDQATIVNHLTCFRDGSSFANATGALEFTDESGKFFISNYSWSGTRKYPGSFSITKETNNTFFVKYDKGDTYTGTLKNSNEDFGYGMNVPNLIFCDGEYFSNGVSEKWINGESFSARHERLKETLEIDIIEEVENGMLSEEQAKEKQILREQQHRKEQLFKNNEVLTFVSNGITKHPGRPIEKIGIDVGDIKYDAVLKLHSDGQCTFHFSTEPSEQAYGCQTIHYSNYGKVRHGDYIRRFCQEVLYERTIDCEWNIEGDTISIKGHDFKIIDDGTKLLWDCIESVELQLKQ